MVKIAHIVNPYKTKNVDGIRIQNLTFQSILNARENCREDVQLFTAQYKEDRSIIPSQFQTTPDLIRTFNDVSKHKGDKKLPLIRDILKNLYEATSADFLIYSNMDIILCKEFYAQVLSKISEGYDSFIINRRRVPFAFVDTSLEEICAQSGKNHPGFDCFIFHRDIFPKMVLGNIVQATFVGVTLAHNLFCFSQNFKLYDNERLTYHLGMKIIDRHAAVYYWFNRKEFFRNIKKKLWSEFDITRFPYHNMPIWRRYWKWARNPSLFVYVNFKLELRKWLEK